MTWHLFPEERPEARKMIVKCKAKLEGKTDCPMLRFCFARMADKTISGCGLPLYMAGVIKDKQDIQVEHTVYKETVTQDE